MEIIVNHERKRLYKFKRSVEEEIVQNVENIVSRIKGNVVLAREKGISIDNVDQPFEYVKAGVIADCMEEIEREEKRFKIESVEVTGEQKFAKMIIKIIGEVAYE